MGNIVPRKYVFLIEMNTSVNDFDWIWKNYKNMKQIFTNSGFQLKDNNVVKLHIKLYLWRNFCGINFKLFTGFFLSLNIYWFHLPMFKTWGP